MYTKRRRVSFNVNENINLTSWGEKLLATYISVNEHDIQNPEETDHLLDKNFLKVKISS